MSTYEQFASVREDALSGFQECCRPMSGDKLTKVASLFMYLISKCVAPLCNNAINFFDVKEDAKYLPT